MSWRELFVGREHEMDQLRAAWTRAKEGSPQWLTILAESGLGKTRIVQEFYNWLSVNEDGEGDAGYWPDQLPSIDNNLLVSPFADQCNSDNAMQYLWIGMRISNPDDRNQNPTFSDSRP